MIHTITIKFNNFSTDSMVEHGQTRKGYKYQEEITNPDYDIGVGGKNPTIPNPMSKVGWVIACLQDVLDLSMEQKRDTDRKAELEARVTDAEVKYDESKNALKIIKTEKQ